MKTSAFKTPAFLVLLLLLQLLVAKAGPLLLQGNDRLAICGDGSENISYSAYIETFLLTSFRQRVTVENFSAMPANPADFLPRLQAGLAVFKPTAALVYLGARSDDDASGAAYRQRLTDLVDMLKKSGVRSIIVGSPLCADPSCFPNDPAKAVTLDKASAGLAAVAKDVATKEGAIYADVFGISSAALAKGRAVSGDKFLFETPAPGSPASIVMAYAFLKALGCPDTIGTAEVRSVEGGAVKVSGGQWPAFHDNTFSIGSSIVPFYFSRGRARPNEPDILQCIPFNDELNCYLLSVKHLKTSQTKITWGDENHDFPSAQLDAGINLTKEFTQSPYHDLFDNLTRLTLAQQEQERTVMASGADLSSATTWDKIVHDSLVSFADVARHAQRNEFSIQPLAVPDPQPPGPIPVIFDTDLDGDVDDVGALAILDDFMDRGEAKVLAILHNTVNSTQSSCGTIKAIDNWYFHPEIPIGQYLGEHPASITSKVDPAPPGKEAYHDPPVSSGSSYTEKVRQRFEPQFPDDDKMPAGVDVYRKVLAAAPDGQVVICSVGVMENIQDLMLSEPDNVSPLSGMDLIQKKVRLLVIMFNTVQQDHYVLDHWPTKIMWSTYIGSNVGSGPSLLETPENNPVRMCYELFGVLHTGRQSWDLTASWLAVRGPGDVFDLVPGRPPYINNITHTTPAPHPDDTEATIKMPYPDVSKLIGAELARPPKK